jgi:uncharacterized membrane protein
VDKMGVQHAGRSLGPGLCIQGLIQRWARKCIYTQQKFIMWLGVRVFIISIIVILIDYYYYGNFRH